MPVTPVSPLLTVNMKTHAFPASANVEKLLKGVFRDFLITQSKSSQQNVLSQTSYRPVVFVPTTAEYGFSAGSHKTTQKRNSKHSKREHENLSTNPLQQAGRK